MMDVALSILALVAGGVVLELFTVARNSAQPDEHQLRFVLKPCGHADKFEAGNPS